MMIEEGRSGGREGGREKGGQHDRRENIPISPLLHDDHYPYSDSCTSQE